MQYRGLGALGAEEICDKKKKTSMNSSVGLVFIQYVPAIAMIFTVFMHSKSNETNSILSLTSLNIMIAWSLLLLLLLQCKVIDVRGSDEMIHHCITCLLLSSRRIEKVIYRH